MTCLLLLVVSFDGWSQIRLYPAYGERVNVPAARNDASARTKEAQPLVLPFFDDFSKPYNTIYPDTVLWENSSSVWVNDGMAIHPPTINVATFDGLNARGRPYNSNEVLLTGYTDTLMSRPIDLSETSVSVAERSGVYLSFFYQWQGNVEPPDEKDHLELSFLTAEEGVWETVLTIYPEEGVEPTIFYNKIVQVSGDQFFHSNFRFRIRAFGRLSGPFDAWHVDYVYLNKGRTVTDLSFPDRALSTQLGPLFGKYRSIPRRHLFSNEQLTPPTFEIQNMKDLAAAVNFRTEGFFSSSNREENIDFPTHETVISKATPIKLDEGNVLNPLEHLVLQMDTLPDVMDPLQFPQDPGIDSTLIRLTIALQSSDNIPLSENGDYDPAKYSPIRFTTNDTLTTDYVLSDYFAYDDGVAEYAAGLIESGDLLAYEFEIDTTYGLKQDTLIGFDVYFPPYAITSNQRVDFSIYHEDTTAANAGLPGELWMRIFGKPVERKGLNEFHRYTFLPAILINEKKFFIGWRQPSAGNVMVGLDISNDTGDKIFVNSNGYWYRNEDVRGSLMIRPVFGSGIIDASVGIGEEEERVTIYPNPTDGLFYMEGNVSDVRIFSLTGQPVACRTADLGTRLEVRVESVAAGLYLVRYAQDDVVRSQKIVIRRER